MRFFRGQKKRRGLGKSVGANRKRAYLVFMWFLCGHAGCLDARQMEQALKTGHIARY
jgi:hypothetical protein